MFYKCIVWHHNRTVASYIRDYRVIRESIWVVNRVKCFSNSSKPFKANKEGDVTEVTADSGNDTSVFCSFGCFMSCNTALSSTLEWPLRSDTISYTLLIILGLFSQPQRHWKPQLVWMCFKYVFMAVVYCTKMAITAVTRVTTHGNGQSQLLYNFKPFPTTKAHLLRN